MVRHLQRKLLNEKRKLEPYCVPPFWHSAHIRSLLLTLWELLGPHLSVQELDWGQGYHLQPKDRSGREERKRKAVRFTQISPLSVCSHFRFCLHVLFSVNNLIIISTNWGLKMWFYSFYVILLNLCFQLYQLSYDFNLTDPYCRLLETSYKSLHDPHLKAYYERKDILRKLKKGGYITSNNKVGWSLLPVNQQKPLGTW